MASAKSLLSDPSSLVGQRVAVYFNLRTFKWSIAEYKSAKCYGRVLAHVDEVTLVNCQFVVRESTRQRMIRNKRRTVNAWVTGDVASVGKGNKGYREVHAWVVGEVAECADRHDRLPELSRKVSYNPFEAPLFYFVGTDRSEFVDSAAVVHFPSDSRYVDVVGGQLSEAVE